MKLTIDTKADTKDEIRKAIKLLIGLVGAHEVYTNEPTIEVEQKPEKQPDLFESPTPSVENLMSMFDTPEQPQETPEEKQEDIPQLEFY